MTKAKKGLIITLFAAMMVFAFGATSAFAETSPTVKWAKDYTTVTLSGYTGDQATWNGEWSTTRTFTPSDGCVVAAPDTTGIVGGPVGITRSYYDLNNAVFAHGPSTPVAATYLKPELWPTTGVTGLIFSAPSYVTNNTETAKKFVYFGTLNAGDWQGAVVGLPDGGVDRSATEDQVFTLSLDVTYDASKETKTYTLGKVADKDVTVKGNTSGDPTHPLFFLDEVGTGSTSNVTTMYDGAEHTVVMKEIKGYTVKYTEYNTNTGEWDDAEEIKITNVGSVNVRAQLYDSKNEKYGDEISLTPTITASHIPTFGFDPDCDYDEAGVYVYKVDAGTEYNPIDYVVVTPAEATDRNPKERRAKQAKYDAAVEANEAEFMAFFNDCFNIVKTTKKADPNSEFLAIERKNSDELDEDAIKTLREEYKQLFANFGFTFNNTRSLDSFLGATGLSAEVVFVPAPELDDQVLFTQAADATYHVKKAKKMKKTKSFTVEAVAASGKAVTYKIDSPSKKITINSETGKVTVKKGLKKGTYKVLVIAGTEKGAGYAAKTAYRQLTIKVKK